MRVLVTILKSCFATSFLNEDPTNPNFSFLISGYLNVTNRSFFFGEGGIRSRAILRLSPKLFYEKNFLASLIKIYENFIKYKRWNSLMRLQKKIKIPKGRLSGPALLFWRAMFATSFIERWPVWSHSFFLIIGYLNTENRFFLTRAGLNRVW